MVVSRSYGSPSRKTHGLTSTVAAARQVVVRLGVDGGSAVWRAYVRVGLLGLRFRPSGSSRGVRLVPVVNRQRVQKALDLISCPVVGNIHGGRLRQTKSARKGRTVTDLHERRQRPDTQKWQSWAQSLPPYQPLRRWIQALT